ncbi:MAG: Unknown protein [uncultured Sulfurovum sp.]|uniref:Cobalamin biosynthesis protein CbiX n=1 Tax=uncultured Sulfurovum sp. TaxID=269237 RepID=A0A6S6SNF7_9BACT|nr:MAG: Unknown protein [uncultured Sulfurovum sp.]
MKSLIIISHGSKKEASNKEVIEIVNQVKNSSTVYENIQPAFLEFATPTIQESIEKCIQAGTHEINIYPYFLNSGKHVTKDIPETIEKLKVEYPTLIFNLLEHFGKSKRINEIISEHIL